MTTGIFIGILIGVLISNVYWWTKPVFGTLRIDHSNPEKDILRLDVGDDLNKLDRVKRVVLNVDNNANLAS